MSLVQEITTASVARLLAAYQEYLLLDAMVVQTASDYEKRVLELAKAHQMSLREVFTKGTSQDHILSLCEAQKKTLRTDA